MLGNKKSCSCKITRSDVNFKVVFFCPSVSRLTWRGAWISETRDLLHATISVRVMKTNLEITSYIHFTHFKMVSMLDYVHLSSVPYCL